MYYLQSRYYNPEWGRFINADVFISTGQGIIGNNMFAYCRNNSVNRVDISGMADVACHNDDGEHFSNRDLEEHDGGGGPSFWNTFLQTMQSAADGLNMATGNRNALSSERHHILSNKNSHYTPLYKEITDRYNMSLNNEENIVYLEGHRGRHTNAYHDFMLGRLNDLDAVAMGDPGVFATGFGYISDFLIANPWLPYAR